MWGAHWTASCFFFFCSNAIKWRHISHHVVIKWYPPFHSLPTSMSIPCTTCVRLWGRWKARALKHKEDNTEPSWTSCLCGKWLHKHVIIPAILQFSYNQLNAQCTLFIPATLPFLSSVLLRTYVPLPILLSGFTSWFFSWNATLRLSPHMWN